MNSRKLLFSKRFFLLNLVMTGGIVGFSLSLLLFSCASGPEPRDSAEAREDVDMAGAEQLQASFRDISSQMLPAVVELEGSGESTPADNGSPWFDFFFGEPEDDVPDEAPDPPDMRPPGLGSGVIVRSDGDTYYILTNDHVVGNASEINITLNDLSEYTGEIVGTDSRRDLALVKFETNDDLPVAPLGDSDDLRVGDWVLAMGSPFGFQSSVTAGIVSATGRMGGPAGNISDFIQTDAAINRGNSGGPLVNLDGEVVGINTWITTQTGGSVGLGFSIPINNAKRAIDQFIETGEVEFGWLGVSIPETPLEIREQLGAPANRGAMIHNIFTDSPAWEYGLQPGDVILSVNGGNVRGPEELTLFVGDLIVGEDATFEIIRYGESMEVTVTIGRRDEEQVVAAQERLWPGFRVDVASEEARNAFSLPQDPDGLLIQAVESRTPASAAGLRRGDLITAVDGTEISDAAELYRALGEARGQDLDIEYLRADDQRSTTIDFEP